MLNYKGLKKILSKFNELLQKNKIKIDDTLVRNEDGTLGVAVPVKPITNAEYEELDEDKKKSSTVWAITDDTTGGGSTSSEVYSTEETKIGTWIDGRPVYRVAIKGNMPTSTGFKIIYPQIENLDQIVSLSGIYTNETETLQFPTVSVTGSLHSNIRYLISGSDGTGVAIYTNNSAVYGKPAIVVVEYTKTTDEATIQVSDNSLKQENHPSVEVPEFNTAASTASTF